MSDKNVYKRCMNAINVNIDDIIVQLRIKNAKLLAELGRQISMEKEERYRKEIEQLKARVDKVYGSTHYPSNSNDPRVKFQNLVATLTHQISS